MLRRTERALVAMIKNVLYSQKVNADARPHLSRTAWLKEHLTVQLGGPRGCGHTMATRVLPKYFRRAVVVYGQTSHAKRQRERIGSPRLGVTTVPGLKRALEKGARFNCIVLDECAHLSAARINQLYQAVAQASAKQQPQCIVLLG
jgi:hypothetical protein